MAEAVIAVIDIIFGLIGAASDIHGLLAGDASNVITVADLERVVHGESARFFTTIAFADIETIRNRFYNIWLPSITSHDRITPDDITSKTGSLYLIFQDLIRVKTELSTLMNRVREVFRTYQNYLHVDELVNGVLAFMHGYALLFHIHGVYAELRRIQIGADSLDDVRLLPDTLTALQYNADALVALDLFRVNFVIDTYRLGMISPLHYYVPPIATAVQWYFGDSYRPLASTPASNSLFVYTDGKAYPESQAQDRRAKHVVTVMQTLMRVYASPAGSMREKCVELGDMLRRRKYAQSGPTFGTKPLPLEQAPLETGERYSGYEFVVTVPIDAAEFIAMSERLRKEVAAESSIGDMEETRRKIRATL